jgi:hypothetical protein
MIQQLPQRTATLGHLAERAQRLRPLKDLTASCKVIPCLQSTNNIIVLNAFTTHCVPNYFAVGTITNQDSRLHDRSHIPQCQAQDTSGDRRLPPTWAAGVDGSSAGRQVTFLATIFRASVRNLSLNWQNTEEYRRLGYINLVRTSQETHYVSVTAPSRLWLCKIRSFHGGDYEECCLQECGQVWISRELTFRRNLSPPSSGWKESAS